MYSQSLNLIFVHVPKCAGTSIIEAIRKIDPTASHGHIPLRGHPERKTKNAVSFSVVRNPWDRVLSCYQYAKSDKSFWHDSAGGVNKHDDYDIANKYSFSDVVKMLSNNRELLHLPHDQRSNFKHNWDHQYKYVEDDNERLEVPYQGMIMFVDQPKGVDNQFKYEDLDSCFEWLKAYGAMCGREIEIPHLNSSVGGGKLYTEEYDDESAELVADIYAEDISRFSYSYG